MVGGRPVMTTRPDIWGRCTDCAQWFPCPDWFERDRAHPVCPRCGTEPDHIQNRAESTTAAGTGTRRHQRALREALDDALWCTRRLTELSLGCPDSVSDDALAWRLHELEAMLETELRRADRLAALLSDGA